MYCSVVKLGALKGSDVHCGALWCRGAFKGNFPTWRWWVTGDSARSRGYIPPKYPTWLQELGQKALSSGSGNEI